MALTKVTGSGADGLTLSSTDVTVASGDLLFGTSAKGVVLGVTSNTAANTLDDYEEGTWTPVLNFGGATTGIAYSQQFGNYTKVGRIVHLKLRIVLSSKGSASGFSEITGVPFTPADDFSSVSFEKGGTVDTWNYLTASNYRYVLTQSGEVQILKIDTTTTSSFSVRATDSDFTNTSDIRLTMTYTT